MDELRPGHVAGDAVFILPAHADARFHLRFDLSHRLGDRSAESIHDALVAAHGVEQRHRLRHREGEIVTHPPLGARSHRQRFAGRRVEVVAHPLEGQLIDRLFQPEPGGTFTTPGADEFLSFAVIVRRRVVAFGVFGTVLLRDADHALFYRIT